MNALFNEMKQGDHMTQENMPIDSNKLIRTVSIEHQSLHDVDPFIGPLIDENELETFTNNTETIDPIEQKHASIGSTHSITPNHPKLLSQIGKRLAGIFCAITAGVLLTCSGFVIKQLQVDFFDGYLSRFILQTAILLTFVLYKKHKFIYGPTNSIILQLVRIIFSTAGFCLFYTAYRYIPLPDLTTYRYTQVIWTAIFGIIIFRERISISTVTAAILTVAGVVLVAQPTFLFNKTELSENRSEIVTSKSTIIYIESNESNRVLGLCLGLACALALSFSMIINKRLMISKVPQTVLMLQYSAVTLVVLIINHGYRRFILNVYQNKTMFTWQYGVAACVSLLQLLSMTLTQQALKLEQPSIVSIIQSSDILFALALQNLFSNVKSNWLIYVGSILVTASIVLVGIHKFWKNREQRSDTRTCSEAKV